MSAPVILRPTQPTDRALENRISREITGRFYRDNRVTNRYWRLADRLWLTEIEDAAALLDLEDRISFIEIEARAC